VSDLWLIAISALIGVGSATQFAMLATMSSHRSAIDSAWISILGTVAAAATLLMVRASRGDATLPSPFDRAAVFGVIAVVGGISTLLAARGLDTYFLAMGLFGLAVISGAAFIGPRIGIALFLAVMIAGQMGTSVLLDHVGAFGLEQQRITITRVAGIVALVAGVALVRNVD
jgi:uncharacterized membrane protein YdcZ (DUF606 family)